MVARVLNLLTLFKSNYNIQHHLHNRQFIIKIINKWEFQWKSTSKWLFSSTVSRSNWNLEMLVFVEGGKPESTRRKTLRARMRTNNKLNTHNYDAGSVIWTWATLVGGECSHYCAFPAPISKLTFHMKLIEFDFDDQTFLVLQVWSITVIWFSLFQGRKPSILRTLLLKRLVEWRTLNSVYHASVSTNSKSNKGFTFYLLTYYI